MNHSVANGSIGFAVCFCVNFEFGFVRINIVMEICRIGVDFVFVVGKGSIRIVNTNKTKDGKLSKSNSVGSAVV